MNLINYLPMRALLLLIFLIASNPALAKKNYTLDCLKNKFPDKHCQKIQNNLTLWIDDIRKVAIQTEIPVALFTAIVAVESHFNPHSHSKFGPIGLTQIQPRTASSFGYSQEILKDPNKNLQAGAVYLKSLLTKYKTMDDVIIAYKTGGKLSQKKIPLSVKNYLQQVLELYAYFLVDESKLFVENDVNPEQGINWRPTLATY